MWTDLLLACCVLVLVVAILRLYFQRRRISAQLAELNTRQRQIRAHYDRINRIVERGYTIAFQLQTDRDNMTNNNRTRTSNHAQTPRNTRTRMPNGNRARIGNAIAIIGELDNDPLVLDYLHNLRLHVGEHVPAGVIANPLATRTEAARDLPAIPEQEAATVREIAPITNDSQNVHDPSVVAGIRGIVDTLRDMITPLTPDQISTAIVNYGIESGDTRTQAAVNVFDDIMRHPQPIVAYNATILDAIRMVWSRITTAQLVEALASCYEDGRIVCAMGCFNRVIETITGQDDIPLLRTRSMFRREILETAARIRTEYEQQPEPRPDFNQHLRDRLVAIYATPINDKTPAAMTREALDAEIAEWIDSI